MKVVYREYGSSSNRNLVESDPSCKQGKERDVNRIELKGFSSHSGLFSLVWSPFYNSWFPEISQARFQGLWTGALANSRWWTKPREQLKHRHAIHGNGIKCPQLIVFPTSQCFSHARGCHVLSCPRATDEPRFVVFWVFSIFYNIHSSARSTLHAQYFTRR